MWDEILGSCFLCSVVELASEERDYPVEALASIIFVTGKHACVWKICLHCLIDVSAQHPAQDGCLGSPARALLSLCSVKDLTHNKEKWYTEESPQCHTFLKDVDKVHLKISGFTLFYCRNNKKLAPKILLSKDRISLVTNLIWKEHHFYLTTSLEHWFIRY